MAKFNIGALESTEEFQTSGGEAIRLSLKRLSRVEKLSVLEYSTRGQFAEAERRMLRSAVTGWGGVQDERGKDVPFSFDRLDQLLGADDGLAVRVHDHLMRANQLAEEEPAGPLGTTSESQSSSTSTAAS